jgi:general nucleoside transport system permease protein
MLELVPSFLSATLVAATPLIFAGLGELVTERAGVLNLGVEGMMLLGAIAAFAVAAGGYSPIIALGAAALTGAAAALLFAVLALSLATNQYATGLALTIFGSGLSGFLGYRYGSVSAAAIGPVLFGLDLLVYLALAMVGAVWWYLYRTRAGLVLRIVGESPQAARAIGFHVIRVRYLATVFGGAMAALGGAYLSIAYTPLWVEDISAGRGWIALALVVFAGWRPWRLVLGAWLFGGVSVVQLFAQGSGLHVPSELLSSLPYIATIMVLVAISRNPKILRRNAPVSLAQPFRPEQ